MKPPSKNFDCVQSMRQIRDKLSAQIVEMSYDELALWLRGYQYSDPSRNGWRKRLPDKPLRRTSLRRRR